ncbi:MAG TPA: DUF6249 domain-containing protein [Flavisolibacter sp.]|jgi:hypothetical protein
MAGPEVLVPITLFAGGFAMVFGIVYLKTKENLAMVEKGMNPKQQYNRPAPFKSLKLGLLLLGAGLGLLLAFIIDANMTTTAANDFHRYNHDANAAIYFALIAMGGGLGLISSYAIERRYLLEKKEL